MSVDLYDILGVSPDADSDEIKNAFRRLAREYHPDRNPDDPEAEARFKEALAAFEILSDPQQRRKYDRHGLDELDSAAKAGVDVDEVAPDDRSPWFDTDRNLGDIFADVLDGESPFDISHLKDVGGFETAKRRASRDRSVPRGDDVVANVEVDFLDAVLGRETEVEVDGTSYRVALKPGTRTGDRLRLTGRGKPAPNPGAEPGDLLLDVEVRDHPKLRRDGRDLFLDVPVTFAEALDGAAIRVPTPEGDVRVDVPRGVDSGLYLRLAGRGVERDGERGDFFAVVQIVSPDDVNEELRDVVERLKDGYTRDVRENLEL
ncbi:MAG: DnaJ C-terminal domain-containing protein [Bradymonadaceae bacterium]